jgi:hypothetical protein
MFHGRRHRSRQDVSSLFHTREPALSPRDARIRGYPRRMASEAFAEVIETLRADVTVELQPLLDALVAGPDDPAVEEEWQRILEEAIRET